MKIFIAYLFTLCWLAPIFCAQPSFSVRQGEDRDFGACQKISQTINDEVFKPIWQFEESEYKEYCQQLDTSAFAPSSTFSEKMGSFLVAEDSNKQIIGYINTISFYEFDQSQETLMLFLANLNESDLRDDFEWLIKKCDGSALFISRLYVLEEWRRQGVGKALITASVPYFPRAKKIYFDTYLLNTPVQNICKKYNAEETTRIFQGEHYESIIYSLEIANINKGSTSD